MKINIAFNEGVKKVSQEAIKELLKYKHDFIQQDYKISLDTSEVLDKIIIKFYSEGDKIVISENTFSGAVYSVHLAVSDNEWYIERYSYTGKTRGYGQHDLSDLFINVIGGRMDILDIKKDDLFNVTIETRYANDEYKADGDNSKLYPSFISINPRHPLDSTLNLFRSALSHMDEKDQYDEDNDINNYGNWLKDSVIYQFLERFTDMFSGNGGSVE